MRTAFLCGAILALAAGSAAYAQDPVGPAAPKSAAAPPPIDDQAPSAAEAGEDVSATVAALQPGMVVKDATGETVGTVQRVTQGADGQAAVIVDVDGRPVNLAPSLLSPSSDGAQALSSMTKAQIQAASTPQ